MHISHVLNPVADKAVADHFMLVGYSIEGGYEVLFKGWRTTLPLDHDKLVSVYGEERTQAAEAMLKAMLDEENRPKYDFLKNTGEVWCPKTKVFASIAEREDAMSKAFTHRYRFAFRSPFHFNAILQDEWFSGHELNEGSFPFDCNLVLKELFETTNSNGAEWWPIITDMIEVFDTQNPPSGQKKRWNYRESFWTSAEKTHLMVRYQNYHDNHTDILPHSSGLWAALKLDHALPVNQSPKPVPRTPTRAELLGEKKDGKAKALEPLFIRKKHARDTKKRKLNVSSSFSLSVSASYTDDPDDSESDTDFTIRMLMALQQGEKLCCQPKKRRRRASRSYDDDQINVLLQWFNAHAATQQGPYPTQAEKDKLCAQTGLAQKQLDGWFSNARRSSTRGKWKPEDRQAHLALNRM